MKPVEDIVKDMLEGYESSLPEGGPAIFRGKIDAHRMPVTGRKPRMLWIAAPVLAAALAVLLFVGKRQPEEQPIDILYKAPVAEVVDETSSQTAETAFESMMSALEQISPVSQAQVKFKAVDGIPSDSGENDAIDVADDSMYSLHPADTTAAETASGNVAPVSPFVPEFERAWERGSQYQHTPKANGLIAAGTTAALFSGIHALTASVNAKEWVGTRVIGTCAPDVINDPINYENQSAYEQVSGFPKRFSLSLRVPLSGRFSYTTGVDWTGNASSSIGEEIRHVYFSVPARIDYSIVHSGWLDIYTGAGASATFCMLVNPERHPDCPRDCVAFSLLGAAGAQLNLSEHLGLFLEPNVSWTIPSENRKWEPYCAEAPHMFSMSAGVRITLGEIFDNE